MNQREKTERRMNQSASTSTTSEREVSLLTSATEDEIVVSQILLDLRNLMSLSGSLAGSNWNRTKRRSCLEPKPPRQGAAPPSKFEIGGRSVIVEASDTVVMVVEKHGGGGARPTASPDTPLTFSPSDESDEKLKRPSKKTSHKRSREEYMDMIEGLAKSKNLLQGEIANVKAYYNKLKAYNSQLKSIKQEVLNSSLRKEEEPQMGMNPGMELTPHYRSHQQPFAADPTAPYLTAQCQPSNNGLGVIKNVGPFLFDLNVPAEEFSGMDLSEPLDVSRGIADKRARSAEARRKRRAMMKTKSSRAGV